MVEQLRNGWSLVLVLLQAHTNEVFGVVRYVLPVPIIEGDLLVADVLIDPVEVLAVEWRPPTQQLVDDDAEAPDVDLLAVSVVLHELGRHVQRRAQDQIQPLVLLELLRKSQVRNLDVEAVVVLLHEQDVLRLHVPMRDRLQMHVVQSEHYLTYNVGRLTLRETVQLRQSIEELATFDDF